jgi:nucleoside-diphosphate-sugar epimerase
MTGPDALIGYSGFVGANILRARRFDALFNSGNIDKARDQTYQLLVCAGASSKKWLANAHPDQDRAAIERLMGALARVRAQKVILISTIEVYPDKGGADEDTAIDESRLEPYGRHRLELERYVQSLFAKTTIVRLPGVFGPGLRKNIVFDLLHRDYSHTTAPDSLLQFYDVRLLWGDLQIACAHRLPIVNIATEPLTLRDVVRACIGSESGARYGAALTRHDMRTRYASGWGRTGAYLYSRHEVLADLKTFAEEHGDSIRATASTTL